MLKKYAALGAAVAALAAVLAAATPATTGVFNSSDREAPRIIVEPTADAQDLYASSHITLPNDRATGAGPFTTLLTGAGTTASNWVPLQNPAGGPYFGKLDPVASVGVGIVLTAQALPQVV
ncbi:MAG: hypothetical protein ACRDPQ_16555 [Nocardioidaceae bacterium]